MTWTILLAFALAAAMVGAGVSRTARRRPIVLLAMFIAALFIGILGFPAVAALACFFSGGDCKALAPG